MDRAGRTFSFGGQKKHSVPPPMEDPIPDLPPVLTLQNEPADGERSRGMTASTASTATPIKTGTANSGLDLGGDFGSMFNSFDKRASTVTLKNEGQAAPRTLTGNRHGPSSPRSPDVLLSTDPLLSPWNGSNSGGDMYASNPTSPTYDRPPPVPRHQSPSAYVSSTRPSDIKEDEESQLLQDTFTALKMLSGPNDYPINSHQARIRREEESFTVIPRNKVASYSTKTPKEKEDNLFEGSTSRFPRSTQRYVTPRVPNPPPQTKVMTPAQFEKYREDKERQGSNEQINKMVAKEEEYDEDEINYEDDEDEAEKSKQQAKQRRKQEAHMAVYRQQMMKVTGEPATPNMPQSNRPGLPSSLSAPQLSQMKSSSPSLPAGASDEDEDEEIPLAILQAHGFPAKNRPPTRLSSMESNPNMRSSVHLMPNRPTSVMGESAAGSRRHSTLPAFARNLPQDPFVGAGIAKPALRESLHFGDAHAPKPPSPLPPGGLVGVIANEERSRALRRGSPSIDSSRLLANKNNQLGFDHTSGIPSHMMYNNQGQLGMGGGMPAPGSGPQMMPGMPQMPPHMMQQMQPPMLSIGDQAQLQMTQQMSQFMQMQMQFMQMMAASQNGGAVPPQQPYNGLHGNQSMGDLSSRHSVVGDPMMEPRRMDYGMRTMSMVQPPSAPMVPQAGYAGSIMGGGGGYAPSMAPSERSNVGLPNRYRPVSQAAAGPAIDHMRANSLSGAFPSMGVGMGEHTRNKSSMNIMNKSASPSDDDDEEGWEAMKAKREKKRSLWRSRKGSVGQ